MENNIVERSYPLEQMPQEQPRQTQVPAAVFAGPPTERVFGAQKVEVRRDEPDVLAKLRKMAAAAGEEWYYRFPVRKKVKNEETGKEEWVRDYIEGPSIKCANNVARYYGNCDIDTRVFDVGDAYMFYARFIDLETGYSLTRPFRQRKGQTMMKTKGDAGRAEDIVFQIGASKAIRNVINNALEFFTSRAADEAKRSIINTVGQKLEFYREKVGLRLKEMGIPLKAVETVRGRPFKDWLAADVALTIAELQAIQDGMATIGETYLDEEPEAETEQPRPQARPASVSDALDQFAGQGEVTATEATPSRQVSPTPEPPNDDVRAAYERGKLDKVKGASRRAVPGEWRTPEMSKLALAWESGWDGAA